MSKLGSFAGWILDIDGVLWRGARPLPGAREFLEELRRRGIPFVLATNNATATPAAVARRARGMGVDIRREQVVTSSQATAAFLAARLDRSASVLVVGERALRSALRRAGLRPSRHSDRARAVVVGLDRAATFGRLTEAAVAIRRGALFVGTNPDKTFPGEGGLVPGNGALLAFLEAATGVSPQVVGKPEPGLFRFASERLGARPSRTVVVGDRLETDIAGGRRAGMATILVLSGVATRQDLRRSSARPDWVFAGLPDLHRALVRDLA
jgi:4-nitrophenyl phosphatase